jgi:hypothetical protein
MRNLLIPLLTVVCLVSNAQERQDELKNGSKFNSVFQELSRGNFKGDVSGMIHVNVFGKDTVCCFMNKPATLDIEYDPDSVYDVSRKHYASNLGNVRIRYSTYFEANRFEITINGSMSRFNCIDGGCDLAINGLEWTYIADKTKEMLFLSFSDDVRMYKVRPVRNDMTVKKGSVLCFTIYRR